MNYFMRKLKEKKGKEQVGVRKKLNPNIAPTIEIKGVKQNENAEEYEVVERVIYPEKIVCPDCGGITLEGLDFCDKCGGEIHDFDE